MARDLHPAVVEILGFFSYDHLPESLQAVSQPFCALAHLLVGDPGQLEGLGLEGAETTVALRKLLEAKDAAVRAATLKIDG